MKYTIQGFSQEVAINMQKNVTKEIKKKNGEIQYKEEIIKLDITDLTILRWLVDFYPKMMKVEIDGTQYMWVSYKDLLLDMPILDIKKDMLYRRLIKMCDLGILKHTTVKVNGTFSYYAFDKGYEFLIDDAIRKKFRRGTEKNPKGYGKNSVGGTEKIPDQINPSTINNSSTKNNNKERKKETTYDKLINEMIVDEEIKDLMYEFIKMRALKKKPLTDRALKIQINKLHKLSTNIEEQKKILEKSIVKNWDEFYPIKDFEKGENNGNGITKYNVNTTKSECPALPKDRGIF